MGVAYRSFGFRKKGIHNFKTIIGMKIYICDINKLKISDEYEHIISQLNSSLQKEINRFRQRSGQLTALTREILFSNVMQEQFYNKNPVIDRNEFGKPFVSALKNPDGSMCSEIEYQDFDFSITHSGNLTAIAFGTGSIGIDLEPLDRVNDFKKLLRFFTEKEQNRMLNSAYPEREFFHVWTYREAFSKAEGTGLTLFEKYPVEIDYKNARVSFQGKKYYFYEYIINTLNKFDSDVYTDYQITVCTLNNNESIEPVIIDNTMWPQMLDRFLQRSASIAYK